MDQIPTRQVICCPLPSSGPNLYFRWNPDPGLVGVLRVFCKFLTLFTQGRPDRETRVAKDSGPYHSGRPLGGAVMNIDHSRKLRVAGICQ